MLLASCILKVLGFIVPKRLFFSTDAHFIDVLDVCSCHTKRTQFSLAACWASQISNS